MPYSRTDKKIKVGFLTERMLLGFGVDLVVHKTACELVNRGFDVTIFCKRSDATYKNEKYSVVEIIAPLFKSPFKTEKYISRMLRNLDKEDIDVWIAETYPFFVAARVMTKPVITVDHGVSSTEGFRFRKKLGFKCIQLMQNHLYFPHADTIINISKFTQSLTPRSLRKKQRIIYNGASNYEAPTPEEIGEFRKQHGFDEQDAIALYVGRLNHQDQPYKGTAELVQTYQALKASQPRLKLIMAGFGSKEDEELLKDEGIIPFVSAPPKTIGLLYSIADVYVTASKWEGFNLPLAEAGLFGVPAVAYDIGAHAEVLAKGAGYLVKTKAEFMERVRLLLENPKQRKRMGQAAKASARRFSWSKAGEEYEKTITSVLDSSHASSSDTDIADAAKEKTIELVDVIVLNHNGKIYLDNLFASLKKQTYSPIKITLVDNGSEDGSADYVKEKFPWVNVIPSKENLFFSRGNNLAVAQTNGEYIFFLNNDTVVNPDAIEKMVETLKSKGIYRVGAVAAKMLFRKDPRVIDSIGTVITAKGSPFNRGIGQIDVGQYDRVEEVFGACFGAVLIRRKVYEEIVEPLDNSYFGYFEDIDWCYRARILGYKTFTCPSAVVYHDHSGTTKKKFYDWKYYLIQRNYLKTLIKDFQLRNAMPLAIWKKCDLLYQTITPNKKKRVSFWIVFRILWNTFIHLPELIAKRYKIQRRRVLTDQECFRFHKNEAPVFDPVAYEPLYNLDNLSMMFNRLNKLNKGKDKRIAKIVSGLKRLKRDKQRATKEKWREESEKFLDSVEDYLGREYVEKFKKGLE